MLLGRVARMYYEHGLTHQEIANALGLSRIRVTRLLAEARDKGLVEIIVHVEESLFADEERDLSARYGLLQAWVAPSVPDSAKADRAFATVGADALGSVIEKDAVVALGLSTAVALVVREVPQRQLGARFVPLAGGASGLVNGANPHEIALSLGTKTGGQAFYLPAPLLAVSAEAARTATADPGVADVLGLAAKADLLVAGLGGSEAGQGLLLGSLDERQHAELRALGAVGDLAGRFFDAEGRAVTGELDERVVGLTLTQMQQIPHRLVIARGASKVDALRVALENGLVNMLVTDAATAATLLA
ncbi:MULTISPECIES: sugar-binding transcriptional regulator [unclassified Plantibacter]|uniref:sugar-binding transcriptional regulator n=1 Tax=unclassified Plantibacter TaxID=2624265 RepID=UPI003D327EE6